MGQDGDVLDILVQKRKNKQAALRSFSRRSASTSRCELQDAEKSIIVTFWAQKQIDMPDSRGLEWVQITWQFK